VKRADQYCVRGPGKPSRAEPEFGVVTEQQRIAGSSVIDKTAAIHEKFLGEGQRLEQAPFLIFAALKIGIEGDGASHSEMKLGPSTSLTRRVITCVDEARAAFRSQCPVSVRCSATTMEASTIATIATQCRRRHALAVKPVACRDMNERITATYG